MNLQKYEDILVYENSLTEFIVYILNRILNPLQNTRVARLQKSKIAFYNLSQGDAKIARKSAGDFAGEIAELEGERQMAIAYSKGEIATEKPDNWEYWKEREGLSEPVEGLNGLNGEKADEANEADDIKEPSVREEFLANGDKRIINYNSRGQVSTVATERDGKIHSVDSYDDGALFETTTYDENGRSTSVTRYDKNGDVLKVYKFDDSDAAEGEKNGVPSVQEQVEIAESDVNTTPTEGQKEAGNYKKGHVQIGKFNVTIEQPKGSVRSGVDANGNKWETVMQNTYGYIRGTEGVDGDHIDVFLSSDIDGWDGKDVFVVDQYNEDGSFDEHKVMLGFNEAEEAHKAYLSNYEKDWSQKHKNVVTAVSIESFEKWINQSHRKTKAFAEYKINKGEAEKVFGVEDVVKRVEEWSEKIDGNGIRVVTRIEDVDNARALEVLKEGKRVDGWYDVANDQVVIYAPNVKSAEDVDKTYVHEVVAHKGVRGFLGKHADTFFERVWNDVMTAGEREYFERYEGVKDIKDEKKRRMAAADEYVAHFAEKDPSKFTAEEKTAWKKIVDYFYELINKILSGAKFTHKDVEDVLRMGAAHMRAKKEGRVEGDSADEANKDRKVFKGKKRGASQKVDAKKEIGKRVAEEWSDAPSDIKDELLRLSETSEPLDVEDVVYEYLEGLRSPKTRNKLLLQGDGVLKGVTDELGLPAKELQKALGMNAFATRANGGISLQKMAERIAEDMDSNIAGSSDVDSTDIRDILIDAISSASEPADISYHRARKRVKMAEKLYSDWKRNEEALEAEYARDADAYNAYVENELIELEKVAKMLPEGGITAIFADEYIREQQIREQYERTTERSDRGSEILQGKRVDTSRGVESSPDGRTVSEKIGGRVLEGANADAQGGQVASATKREVRAEEGIEVGANKANGENRLPEVEAAMRESELKRVAAKLEGLDRRLAEIRRELSEDREGESIQAQADAMVELYGGYANAPAEVRARIDNQVARLSERRRDLIEEEKRIEAEIKKTVSDLAKGKTGKADAGGTRFSVYGGNSGYEGYSMSKRAAEAREEGRYPKTDFKKEYGLNERELTALVDAGIVSDKEWHHTSKYGNKTVFYGFANRGATDYYNANKDRVKQAIKDGTIGDLLPEFADASDAYDVKESDRINKELEDYRRDVEKREEYYEYLKTVIPSEYTASNGVVVDSKGSNLQFMWSATRNGKKPKNKNAVYKAFEEFAEFLSDKVPSFEEWSKEGLRFRFSETEEEFRATQKEAVEKKGIVMPNLNNAVVEIVDVPEHNFKGNLKEARAEAKKWAIENYVGKEFAMPNNGGAYIINRRAVSKYLDKTAVDISDNPLLHLSALTKIPEIISNSITGEIHADYKKDNKGSRKLKNGIDSEDLLVHRLYGAINIDGIIYRVKTTMHEHLSNNKPNKPHSYEVTKIELLEDRSLSGHMNRSNSSIDGAKLLDGVEKSYDKGKYLLEESENLDNLTTEEDIRFRVDDEDVAVKALLGNQHIFDGMRKLEEGETSYVERTFSENKSFEFNSKNFIKGYDDVAYIFKQLENESVENAFAVLVKNGRPTVIHLGMGGFTQTMVNQSGLNVAVNRIKPDKIYFVHNHPSGTLKSSVQDRSILNELILAYGSDVVQYGIIINSFSGKYGIFSSDIEGMSYDMPNEQSGERPIKVYSFNKQVYDKNYQPTTTLRDSEEVAAFITSQRLGDRQKIGLLVADNQLRITGNIFLPYSEFTRENADKIANDITYYTSVMGGNRAFLFGNASLRDLEGKNISERVKNFSGSQIQMLDYVEINGGRHKSAYDEGVRFRFIGEKGAVALDKAEESSVRLDNLDVAREMENAGKEAKAIKMATGWERGADGKWRYEVSDGEFDGRGELHPERRQLTKEEQSELDNAFDELMDAFEKGALAYDKEITGETDMADIYVAGGMSRERAERLLSLEDKEKELKKSKKHLDDYLDDEGLYAAYPELREIEIVEGDPMLALTGLLGGYDHKNKTLTLYDLAKDTLLHEVQHIIQHIEGFARGGNAKDVSEARRLNAQMQREVESLLNQLDINEWLSRGNIQDIILRNQKEGRYFNLGYAFSESLNEIVGDVLRQNLDEANRVIAENNRLIGGHSNLSPKEHYRRLGGEVEARNVAKRMSMSAEERRNSIAEETEDVSRADQIFIMDGLGVSEMGSRVDGRMKEVGKHFDGQRLSEEQRAVVDVYSGVRNNLTINVKTKDGNRAIVIRQGTENKAGTKHSLFRHYDTGVGTITAEDIALIPEIIANGAVTEKKRGKSTLNEYKLSKNDVDYTVLTEVDSRREVFADFYTNKKTSTAARSTHSEDARDTAVNVSDGKVSEKTGDLQTDSNESEGQVRFSVREDGEYVAPWDDAFNAEIENIGNKSYITIGKANDLLKSLGMPKYADIYVSRVNLNKAEEKGIALQDLKNLPSELSEPLAVFGGYADERSVAVLTNLKTGSSGTRYVWVTLVPGVSSIEAKINVVNRPVEGRKGTVYNSKIVDWINEGKMLYVDKEKMASYMADYNSKYKNEDLISATEIVDKFDNPKVVIEIEKKKVVKDPEARKKVTFGEYTAPYYEGESFAEAMDRLSRKKNVLNVEVQRMERRRAMGGDIDEADEYVPVSDKILNVTYSAFI